jgi:hypothetical protein
VEEVADTDVARYTVVRVADEVVVDLMALACGIDYDNAAADAVTITIDGVAITVASPATLIRTKNTIRPSDAADRQYLEELVRAEGGETLTHGSVRSRYARMAPVFASARAASGESPASHRPNAAGVSPWGC